MHNITELPAWERLFKKIVWKQLGKIKTLGDSRIEEKSELVASNGSYDVGLKSFPENQDVQSTFISLTTKLSGKLNFEGATRIEGEIEGEINAKGELTVGENAKIHADITGDVVIISGEVNGNIKALERLVLKKPANITGNIETPSLIIEAGVIFHGGCSMG